MHYVLSVFKWGESQELVPPATYHALKTVGPLRMGRSNAKESEKIQPVPEADVEPLQSYVSRQTWALIQLQLHTGARGGELVMLRAIDIDMSEEVWIYKPTDHKTAHLNKERIIWFGPKAQEIIHPFLNDRPVSHHLFSANEACAEWWAKRREQLGSKPWPRRKVKTKRRFHEFYSAHSYWHAILQGCKKAGVDHWHPHQLRHTAATNLRREFGIEVARIILGHTSSAMTEVYAERDQSVAIDVIRQVG